MEKKFKFFNKELGMTEAFTIGELKSSIMRDCYAYETCLQYLGYKADERELYEGDIIELIITEDLMDIHKNGFSNSNMGNYIKESIADGKPITSIVCAINTESNTLTTGYDIYCLRNGKIQRNKHGDLETDASSYNDSYFPSYLASKGAKYIGNILETPDILQEMGTLWEIPVNKFYVTMYSCEDMITFADSIGIENIITPCNDVEETYRNGYIHCLIDVENNVFQMINWQEFDSDLSIFKFTNFKYSNIWHNILKKSSESNL